MKASDWIALCSLLFAAIALGGQIWSWIARRGRLKVTARIVSGATVWDGFGNKFYVLIEARSLGRSNGVERVDVEWREDPGEWSMTPADQLLMPQTPGQMPRIADALDVFKAKRVLAEHETAAWAFRISVGGGHEGLDRLRELRAVVVLVNGRKFRSDYFVLPPDAIREEEDAGEGRVEQ